MSDLLNCPFCGAETAEVRERDAYERGFKAALEKAAGKISLCLWGNHWTLDGELVDPDDLAATIHTIPLPDTGPADRNGG